MKETWHATQNAKFEIQSSKDEGCNMSHEVRDDRSAAFDENEVIL